MNIIITICFKYFRYKIEMIVMDNTSYATFFVFGIEAEKMVNLDVNTLFRRMEERVRSIYFFIWIYLLIVFNLFVYAITVIFRLFTLS